MPVTKKFSRLLRSVERHYIGKRVPVKWRPKYGKVYSRKEAKIIAISIARKKGWRI